MIDEIVKYLNLPEDKLNFMKTCKKNHEIVLKNIVSKNSSIKLVYYLEDQKDLEKLKLRLIEIAQKNDLSELYIQPISSY